MNIKFSLFSHDEGKISRLPLKYDFPKMTLVNLIVMWFCGDVSKKIVPYCLLNPQDIEAVDDNEIIIRNRKDKFCKMKSLMSLVEEAAKREGVWTNRKVGDWTIRAANELAVSVEKYFSYKCKHKRRISELAWKTVFLLYSEHGKKFATDLN